MTREVDYINGDTIVDESFLDALQEVVSALSTNTRVIQSSSTQVQIVPGNSDGATMGMTINGRLRYATGVKSQTISGSAGTYNVWATADSNDRNFSIAFATTSAPAGVTNYRKIATLVWSGTAITSFTSLLGAAPLDGADFTAITVATPAANDDSKKVPNTEWINDAIMDAMPVGALLDYTLPTLPAGGKWEWADGGALTSGNTAAALYRAALLAASSPYGTSSGDPRKPDYRGRTGQGRYDMGTGNPGDADRNVGSTLGAVGGKVSEAITLNQLPPHEHTGATYDVDGVGAYVDGAHGHNIATGDSGDHIHGSPSQPVYTLNTSGRVALGAGTSFYPVVSGNTSGVTINAAGNHSHSGSTTTNGAHGHYVQASSITGWVNPQVAYNKMQPHILVGKIVKVG